MSHSACGSGLSQYTRGGPAPDLRHHLGPRRVMVAVGVTDHDHRAARAESVAPVALPERLEHAPVVAVAVVADHAAGLEQLPRLDRPVGRSHQRADLVDRVDEGERARRSQLVGQRRDQRECEPGEVGHRSRHVAEHEQFGTMCSRAAIDDVERDAASGEGSVDRATDVDPPGTARLAAVTQLRGEPAGERADRGADVVELARRGAGQLDVEGISDPSRFVRPARLDRSLRRVAGQVVQPSADLVSDHRPQRCDPGVECCPVDRLTLAAGASDGGRQDRREVDRPEHAVEVVPLGAGAVVESGEPVDDPLRQQLPVDRPGRAPRAPARRGRAFPGPACPTPARDHPSADRPPAGPPGVARGARGSAGRTARRTSSWWWACLTSVAPSIERSSRRRERSTNSRARAASSTSVSETSTPRRRRSATRRSTCVQIVS